MTKVVSLRRALELVALVLGATALAEILAAMLQGTANDAGFDLVLRLIGGEGVDILLPFLAAVICVGLSATAPEAAAVATSIRVGALLALAGAGIIGAAALIATTDRLVDSPDVAFAVSELLLGAVVIAVCAVTVWLASTVLTGEAPADGREDSEGDGNPQTTP